jgi:hypothetical protein
MKYLLPLFAILTLPAFAQKKESQHGPKVVAIADYYGLRQNTFAIGVGVQPFNISISPLVRSTFGGITAFYEVIPGEKRAFGAHLGFSVMSPLSFEFNLNYHRNNITNVFGFKPSIGFSIYRFTLMYGYNFFKETPNLPRLRHNIFHCSCLLACVDYGIKHPFF